MSYVDKAFEKMRSSAEVTTTEQNVVSRRHKTIRGVLEATWDVDRTFLTGSYDRHTKIKPLEDVDIFMAVDPNGAQAHLRHQAPDAIISGLLRALDGKFKKVVGDGMAVRIHMSDDDGQATFEVVPAFEHSEAGFEVPDPDRGRWIRTDPNEHAKLTSKKNGDCNGMWVPFAKMLKCWNYEVGKAIPQSFLIEVMALDLVRTPFGRYQDETAAFFGNLIDTYRGPWPDPASLGPAVDELLTSTDRQAILSSARTCSEISEEAVYLEDQGKERKAVEKWREIFGSRMPRP